MKAHLSNAAYGILDYAAYPVGMLLVAPVVLHHLGAAAYGLWSIATAAVSAGGIIASGFGDANIQHIARLRGQGKTQAIVQSVRSMIGINLVLGLLLAIAGWLLSPYAARHIVVVSASAQHICLVSLRIASVLMLVRALESVSISTWRAFEQYGAAVQISIAARLLSLAAAALLAYAGQGMVRIMLASAVLLSVGTATQLYRLYRLVGATSLWPSFDRDAMRSLFGSGIYSWLQAVAGVIFGQADRLLLGVSMGATAVASYALCIQLSQPIFGLTSSGLHFLFPYLASRAGTISPAALRRTVLRAFACNFLLISIGTALLLAFGLPILRVWAGAAIAQTATPIFPLIVIGSALLGLSVTGTYALMALGCFRLVAWLSVAGGVFMLLLMTWLTHRNGEHGLAIARLGYGAFSLLLYLPLMRRLRSAKTIVAPAPMTAELGEIAPL